MNVIGQVATSFGVANIGVGRYPAGGDIFVQLTLLDGQPLTTFSVNLRPYGGVTARDEFHVKNWDGNEQLVEPMLATGLFVDTGRRTRCEYIEAPVWFFPNPAQVP
ncbi:hypothetical protein [Ottowia sp.]|uniref:hypothetical protein n=1 Tax=Ottowia sp. TaxID=1898956 RepID=UPI0025EF9F7B|nr:hypothetical protein [Ottowia sp.]MBK6616554.1 hypothetical protein [Ottowia sp.]